MKKKADLIANYEAQIDALYGAIEKKEERIRNLELRIELYKSELADLVVKVKELTLDTIEELKQ